MSNYICKEERFLEDVQDHKLEIVHDNGNHRHLKFRTKKSYLYWFDLITWTDHLCITGDCGTYVFSRLTDMFQFFRMDDNDFNKNPIKLLNINPGYWGEKLKSVDRHGGYVEFDKHLFEETVREYFDEYWEDSSKIEEKKECWQEIEDCVLSNVDDGGEIAYQGIWDFDCNGFSFPDFLDGGGTDRYTIHYIWCLYAIVYGINKYDKFKKQKI